MFKLIRRSYLLFVQKLPMLLLFLLPLLLFEAADTAVDKDQISQVGVITALLAVFLKIEIMLVIYTYLLDNKLRLGYEPLFMLKFLFLDFGVTIIAAAPTLIVFHLLDVTFVNTAFPVWFYEGCLIITMLYTLWILPRLSLLYPRFIKGESIRLKNWWQATSDKNWRWLLAGLFICGPDLFSRFWNYNTYVEIIWSNLVLLLPVCFSVVYYKKNRKEEK